MSDNTIRPGDLVMVVKAHCYCVHAADGIGHIYKALELIMFDDPTCMRCGRVSKSRLYWRLVGPGGLPPEVLKKIPPLADLETLTDSADDPMYKVVPLDVL